MQGTAIRGSGCASTGWTAATALAVGCCGGGGTTVSGLGAHGRAAGLRSLSSGHGGEQSTGTVGPGHWQ